MRSSVFNFDEDNLDNMSDRSQDASIPMKRKNEDVDVQSGVTSGNRSDNTGRTGSSDNGRGSEQEHGFSGFSSFGTRH